MYSFYNDKIIMQKTNMELQSLFEPFINNTVVVIDKDKYFLRIKEVKLSDHVKPYKYSLNDSAYVIFDIYKNKISADKLINTRGIHMSVWRTDLNSKFVTTAKTMSDISYKSDIFNELTYLVFDSFNESIENSLLNQYAQEEYASTSGHGRYYEDEIEINRFGEITSEGEVYYECILYRKGLSMKFTTRFYIENLQEYHEMHIKTEKAEGDYHPLWDMKVDDIDKIEFYYDGNYEGKSTITKKNSIRKMVTYFKSIPFEKLDEPVSNFDTYIYITFDNYQYNVLLSKNAVLTNSNHALCKGENFVKQIIKILEEDI